MALVGLVRGRGALGTALGWEPGVVEDWLTPAASPRMALFCVHGGVPRLKALASGPCGASGGGGESIWASVPVMWAVRARHMCSGSVSE